MPDALYAVARGACSLLLLGVAGALAPRPAPAEPVTWSDLAPLVQERCVLCHSGETAPAGLRLGSLEGLLAGSSDGPVVLAGDAEGSELMRRLRGDSLPRMPMTGPPFLAEADIARFARWIEAGMPAGSGEADPGPAAAASTPRQPPPPGEVVTWTQVAPLFARRCAKCHTEDGMMGGPPEGLRLDAYARAVASGERARVVPGNPEASAVLRRIRGQERPRMPFDGPPWLNDSEIELVARWIADGARDAAGEPAPQPAGARVRLEGRLSGRWALDGLALRVDGRTRIDDSPRVGDYVQVRGRIAPDGGVQVERLRRR